MDKEIPTEASWTLAGTGQVFELYTLGAVCAPCEFWDVPVHCKIRLAKVVIRCAWLRIVLLCKCYDTHVNKQISVV